MHFSSFPQLSDPAYHHHSLRQSLPSAAYSLSSLPSPTTSSSTPPLRFPRRSDTQETMTQASYARSHRPAFAPAAGMDSSPSPDSGPPEAPASPSAASETSAAMPRSSTAPFASAIAVSHEDALRVATSPFANNFPQHYSHSHQQKQDNVHDDLAQYLDFNNLGSSPLVLAQTPPGFVHQHASPPPASEVDPDGTSPALSFVGTPSPTWSPVGEASLIPHPTPLSHPAQSCINTLTRSPTFDTTSAYSPQISAFESQGAYGLGLVGSIPANENMSYGGYGFAMGAGMGDLDPDCAFAPLPWDSFLSGSPEPVPVEPTSAVSDDQTPQQQAHFVSTPGHQFISPSLAQVPMAPRPAPFTPPAISPRDLELDNLSSSAPTPYWAAHIFESPTSPTGPMGANIDGRMLLGSHGRSMSDAVTLLQLQHQQQRHQQQQQPSVGRASSFAFVPPSSVTAAIPIPHAGNTNDGLFSGDTSFGGSAALAQLFQPSSAPVTIPGNQSSSFMASTSLGFPSTSLFGADDNGNAMPQQRAQENRGPSSNLRSRFRSVSQRVGSGLRDAQRAVFHTRAAPYPREDAATIKTEQDVARLEMEWANQVPQGFSGMDIDGSHAMDGTLRVVFPGNNTLIQEDSDATVRRPRKKRNSNASTDILGLPQRPSSGPSSSTSSLLLQTHSRDTSTLDNELPSGRGRATSGVSEDTLPSPPGSKDDTTLRSELRPPKLAPSTWQLYFTDWIARHQVSRGDRKLNVAQAAKEAGAEYAVLSDEEKEPYKRRSQALKEAREREHAIWQRTLTPEAIKRENAFRAQQRRTGRSRRGNIKDPNAPKKPLSAYFMFLQYVRADSERVKLIFGDEKETTAQSVLAARHWREMTDDERKPFLAQAEKEKLEYEAARRLYEEGTVGFETTISFDNVVSTSSSSAAGASGSSSRSRSGGRGAGTNSIAFPAGAGVGAAFVMDFEGEVDGEESEGFYADDDTLRRMRM